MQVQPYLFFDGRCEEALDFYKKALGAKVEMLMRFKESPEGKDNPMCSPGSAKIVLKIPRFTGIRCGTKVMSTGPPATIDNSCSISGRCLCPPSA